MHRAKGLCGLRPSLLGKKGGRTGGRGLVVCAVVSFPFGMDIKEQKPSQCLESFERGAKELDIVMNFSACYQQKHGGFCKEGNN
jgi:deoxyribose-phosphate aldolase